MGSCCFSAPGRGGRSPQGDTAHASPSLRALCRGSSMPLAPPKGVLHGGGSNGWGHRGGPWGHSARTAAPGDALASWQVRAGAMGGAHPSYAPAATAGEHQCPPLVPSPAGGRPPAPAPCRPKLPEPGASAPALSPQNKVHTSPGLGVREGQPAGFLSFLLLYAGWGAPRLRPDDGLQGPPLQGAESRGFCRSLRPPQAGPGPPRPWDLGYQWGPPSARLPAGGDGVAAASGSELCPGRAS